MPTPEAVIVPLLSRDRLEPYLHTCGNDLAATLRLYAWNTAITGAFWETLGHFEVLLRNVIDRKMIERHVRLGRRDDWLDDPAGELSAHAQGKVADARMCVRRKGKPMSHGQIISELPFGFWRFLLARQHQSTLWPDLASAFPHAPNRALRTVELPVKRLHEFRNRIAHHERIWAMPLDRHYYELLGVLGFVDPAVRSWVDGASRVQEVLRERP